MFCFEVASPKHVSIKKITDERKQLGTGSEKMVVQRADATHRTTDYSCYILKRATVNQFIQINDNVINLDTNDYVIKICKLNQNDSIMYNHNTKKHVSLKLMPPE